MKIYSYLDSGKPVLATRLYTHTQVLDDQISYLVEPTPLEMALGMEELIEDGELRSSIASQARGRLQDEYGPEVLHGKLAEFYEEVAETIGNAAQS